MPRVIVDGKRYNLKTLGWRTLTLADGTSQDTTGLGEWEWFFYYQPTDRVFLGFTNRRDRRGATKWSLLKNATTEVDDSTEIRLVVYEPDGQTQKAILLHETYGTLKNASRDDIQNLINPTMKKVMKPGDYLYLEGKGSEVIDVSNCDVELGYKLMTD